ncbi:tRNA(Met) C34 N-acetyltransferase TmcA [Bradyrhizobium japonicum]
MAETHSAEELINKAAAILGKYVPGEALGDVEHATIDKCVDDVLAEIAKIVVIGDRDEIPNVVFETVARLVAIYAAAEFSNQPLDLAAIAQHEMRLRYLVAQTPTYEILATNHF